MTRLHTYLRGLLVLLVTLSGCGTMSPNSVTLKSDAKSSSTPQPETVIAIDPVALAGIPLSDDIRSGNFIALLAAFPDTDEAVAEYDPFRVSYPCYAVDASGRSYPAHALFAGYVGMRVSAVVLVEGLKVPRQDVRIVWLSTRVRKAFTLTGTETVGFDAKRFQSSSVFREEFTMVNGTASTSLKIVSGMDRAIASWRVYETKAGTIASPFTMDQIQFLAGKNPMYSFREKLIGTGSGSVSVTFNPTQDLIVNAAQLGFNLAVAAGSEPMGFDYESKVSRTDFGRMSKIWKGLMEQQNIRLALYKQSKGGQ